MTALIIPRTIEQVEASIAQLVVDEPVDEIRIEGLHRPLGSPLIESSLAYWLLTVWHHARNKVPIVIEGEGDAVAIFERGSSTLPGAILCLLPWGVVKNVSRQALARTGERVMEAQRNWPDLAPGTSARLLCADSKPTWLSPELYPDPGAYIPGSWEQFLGTMEKLVDAISSRTERSTNLERHLPSLTTIFGELFKNTHQHARHWWDYTEIDSSVRGLFARYYQASELTGRTQSEDTPLEIYFRNILSRRSHGRHRAVAPPEVGGCFELSVFDSGPGLAQKWLGRDCSREPVEAEYEAVLECFEKGRSSLPNIGRGFGLSKVLETVRALRGLIRVRTNRVHLYRQYETPPDLGMRNLPSGKPSPRETLLDWRRGLSERPSAFCPIRGTVISILIPDERPL
jgi:hypothetical protein